ncbi:MAG TPA: hypothetical protein VIY28_05575 [Pseudonocardiaceae bacterium]
MALRAHAWGLLCAVAAVELLVGHAVWLRRDDFVGRFVDTGDDLAGEGMLAWVKWPAVVRALDAGRLGCSGSEAGVLRIAASLAEGVPLDLGDAVSGLDAVNGVLVARAVLAAGGHHAAAGDLAGRVCR